MRRTAALASAITFTIVSASSSLVAQTAPDAGNSAGEVRVELTSHTVRAVADQRVRSTSMKAQIGRMVTGAVVGGALGYFASQIVVSDWEEGPESGSGTNRRVWAAGGVVAGAVAGRLLSPGPRTPEDLPDMTRGRMMLAHDEIVRSGASNALDLIRGARPEWLVPRGVHSWRDSARGGADNLIRVYLDNARIGGTQNLEGITLGNVARIEFIEPAAASFRWGGGHAHGVILITTLASTP